MKKRLIALASAALIAMSSICNTASITRAATDYSVYYNQFQNAILDQCVSYQKALEDTGSKQYGLLYSLKVLSQYSMYIEFLGRYYKDLGVSSKTVSSLERDLHVEQDNFNKKFGVKNKGVGYVKMDKNLSNSFVGISTKPEEKDKSTHSAAKTDIRINLVDIIPKYLNKVLKQVDSEVKKVGNNEEKKAAVETENTTLLTNVYSVYVGMLSAEEDLGSYTPFTSESKQKDYKVFKEVNKKKKYMDDALKDAVKDYDYLMRIAKAAYSEEIEEDIDCDLGKAYVENLSNSVVRDKQTYYPKTVKVSKLYYAIMAASAVYVPFQSYLGNSEFQHALKSLTNDDTVKANMIEFYSATKDLRKPLYKREFDDMGYPTGEASLMTIQDFIDDIEKEKSGALVTILGNLSYSSESGSWVYVQSSDRTDVSYDYTGLENNADSEISDSETDSAAETTTKPLGLAGIVNLFSFLKPVKAKAAPTTTEEPENTEEPEATPEATEEPADGVVDDVSEEVTDTDVDVKATLDEAVYAYKTITDETKMSEPIYMYGADYTRAVDNTTFMLLKNIIKSCSNISAIKSKSSRYIYVNAYGDIVTDDNLVLVPGIANPLLYNSTSQYNPYTAAFMNTYPQPFQKNSSFRLTSKRDVGKFLIVRQKLKKPSVQDNEASLFAVKTDSIDSVKASSPLKIMEVNTGFRLKGQETHKPLKYNRLLFKSSKTWKSNKDHEYTPLIYSDTVQINGKTIFPYVPAEDLGFNVADTIANAAYVYLAQDNSVGDATAAKAKINENYVVHNLVVSGLQGTNNPKGYSTSIVQQAEQQLDASMDKTKEKLVNFSKNVFEYTSNVRGVIGLRDCLQNPVLGRILVVCRSNIFIFFLIIGLIMLYSFSRMRLDLFQVIIKSMVGMLAAFLMITVIPTYLPMIFNIVINNVSENLTYKTLAIQTENESIGNEKLNSTKEDGTKDLTSGSITLFRAGVLNWKDFLGQVNCDEEDLVGGNYETINLESGFFAQGDALKVNTSVLFDTLKIEDATFDADGQTLHYLKSYKTVTNNVDYYAPYYNIVDGFLDKMRSLEEISAIPRSTVTYANGTIKDNFLVHSYVNSSAFLTPGKYGIVMPEDSDADDATNKSMQKEANQYAQRMEQVFGDKYVATDFLGLSSWLINPTSAMKKTLWFKTMQDQGYYDKNGDCPDASKYKRRMNKLISYVNYHTRKFIFDMDGQIGRLSDDTMVKMISMRALVALTQEVSDFGNWLYPYSLNYEEMSLSDVVQTVFINDYNIYTTCDLDVVTYIAESKGWITLIVFDLVIICLFVLINVVQWLVYLMYAILGIALVAKIISQGDAAPPIKGFLKCGGILMGAYSLLAVTFTVVEKANGNTFCLYAILLVVVAIAYLITMVVTSIVADKADLGNNAINAKLSALGGGAFRGLRQTVANFVANTFRTGRRYSTSPQSTEDNRRANTYDQYRYDSNMDDLGPSYNSFNRYSASDDYSEPEGPVRDANGYADDLTIHEEPEEYQNDLSNNETNSPEEYQHDLSDDFYFRD